MFDLPIEPVDKLQLVKRPGPGKLSFVSINDGNAVPTDIEFEPGDIYALYSSDELRRTRIVESMVGQTKSENGYVLLNGFRVDEINAESLQTKIGFVRDIEIFAGTIDENIRLGREGIGSHQVNQVVNSLGLNTTIAELPGGFLTHVNISGHPLSPGQAIRLTLARALAFKPGLLIVDGLLDRLSDVDADDVLYRLKQLTEETTIVIATGRGSIANQVSKVMKLKQEDWVMTEYSG